jgi:hypothetical protein
MSNLIENPQSDKLSPNSILDSALNGTANYKRKNAKHPPIYAMYMEQYLFEKNPVFDDTMLLLRSAHHAVAMLEEAVRVGCGCFYSVRRSCWILYDYQPWKLNPELEKAGVKIEKIKNREKDYGDIMEMM